MCKWKVNRVIRYNSCMKIIITSIFLTLSLFAEYQSSISKITPEIKKRMIQGNKKWSKHSYGKAIDINPIENPYISRSGRISHKESLQYRKRVHTDHTSADKAVLLKNDKATKIFKKYGWKWGGDWNGVKDYQHFSK